MKLIDKRVLKDVEEDQVSLLPEDPEDMVCSDPPVVSSTPS